MAFASGRRGINRGVGMCLGYASRAGAETTARRDAVLCDNGLSGVSTRLAERPEGRRLFDMLREGDTLVVRQARA